MQNSRINVNEAGSPHAVVVDFHNAAWELLDRDTPYGFAFQKTVEHLGLEPTIKNEEGSRLYLYGSAESVKTHVHDLHRHIGVIARYGAQKEQYFSEVTRDHMGRILGRLAQTSIPNLPENATLMRTVGAVAYPFVDAVSSDLTEVYYARKPYWQGTNEAAKHADGTPMRPYDARDIGGFVIGWDGLAVHESISAGVKLDPIMAEQLRWLADVRGTRLPEEVRRGFRQFLDMPEKPMVEHTSVKAEDDGVSTTHRLSFPRTDMKELFETYQPPDHITFGDIIRFAAQAILTDAAADPQLAASMEQNRQVYLAARALW